jgi:hypothetical protein
VIHVDEARPGAIGYLTLNAVEQYLHKLDIYYRTIIEHSILSRTYFSASLELWWLLR